MMTARCLELPEDHAGWADLGHRGGATTQNEPLLWDSMHGATNVSTFPTLCAPVASRQENELAHDGSAY